MVGGTWRVLDTLRLEAAVSHMSTNALALYVRRYLESVDPANVTRIQNNLFITAWRPTRPASART